MTKFNIDFSKINNENVEEFIERTTINAIITTDLGINYTYK